MNKMLRLAALSALLACAGMAGARSAAPDARSSYLPQQLSVNPQPLPPLHPDKSRTTALVVPSQQPALQVAGATDIRYCWQQCTPGSGCELVCRHLAW